MLEENGFGVWMCSQDADKFRPAVASKTDDAGGNLWIIIHCYE